MELSALFTNDNTMELLKTTPPLRSSPGERFVPHHHLLLFHYTSHTHTLNFIPQTTPSFHKTRNSSQKKHKKTNTSHFPPPLSRSQISPPLNHPRFDIPLYKMLVNKTRPSTCLSQPIPTQKHSKTRKSSLKRSTCRYNSTATKTESPPPTKPSPLDAIPLARILPPPTKTNKTPIHLLKLPRCSPLLMLHIEERLLRHDGAQNGNATPDGMTETPKRNFAIFNRPLPHHNSVVLGISGKPSQLVNTSLAEQDNIPLIKRFTGGGTVYITSDIRFVGFIINKSDISHVDPYPTPVMRWTGEIYEDCITSLREKSKTRFEKFGKTQQNEENLTFSLYENDYCLGNTRDEDTPDEGSGDEIKTAKALKFAGNAQSFIRDRILHHTSILWDLDIDNISKYLTLPSKRPAYRLNRSHRDFLTDLRPLFDPKNKEQNIDYFDDFCVGDNDIDNKAVIGGCEYTHHFTLGKNKLLELQDELQVITSAYYEELNRLRRENNVENGEKSQIDEKIAEKTAEYKKRRGEYQIRMDAIPFPNLYQYLENNLNQYHKHKSMLIGMGGVNNPEECQFNDAMLDALNQHFDVKVLSIEDVKDVLDCSDGQLGTYIIPPS